jgi:hypothetical protein
MYIYLVLENHYGDIYEWTKNSKAFLERSDAQRYRHELMMTDEYRMNFVPSPLDTSKSPDETGLIQIKEVWMEC